MRPRAPRSSLFPYTTLFRSRASDRRESARTRARGASVGARYGLATHRQPVSRDRKSTRLNSSHQIISYAVFCLKKKKGKNRLIDAAAAIGTTKHPTHDTKHH